MSTTSSSGEPLEAPTPTPTPTTLPSQPGAESDQVPNVTINYPTVPGFPQPQNQSQMDLPAWNKQIAEQIADLQAKLHAEVAVRKAAQEQYRVVISQQKAERRNAALTQAATERGAIYPDVVTALLPEIESAEDGTPQAEAVKAALDTLAQEKPGLFGQARPVLGADAGASGGGNARTGVDDLNARIQEAQNTGDWKTAIALKTQLMALKASKNKHLSQL